MFKEDHHVETLRELWGKRLVYIAMLAALIFGSSWLISYIEQNVQVPEAIADFTQHTVDGEIAETEDAFVKQIINLAFFVGALLHMFVFIGMLEKVAERLNGNGGIMSQILHIAMELELVIPIWAGFYLAYLLLSGGFGTLIHHLNEVAPWKEPLFVFNIMVLAGSSVIIICVANLVTIVSKWLPINTTIAYIAVNLILGALIGSVATEPTSMTVVATLLASNIFMAGLSEKFSYSILAVLFLNVSIGGTITNFAAPPVLIGAEHYGLSTLDIAQNFGWKMVIVMLVNVIYLVIRFKDEILKIEVSTELAELPPMHIILGNLAFIIVTVIFSHQLWWQFVAFPLFVLFWWFVSRPYEGKLEWKNALIVGVFPAGLLVIGHPQKWWIAPLLESLGLNVLFLSVTGLTGISDNALLVFLGTLADLHGWAIMFLIAGSLLGAGLTIVANAPNPAGFAILKKFFPTFNAGKLAYRAIPPTVISCLAYLVLTAIFG